MTMVAVPATTTMVAVPATMTMVAVPAVAGLPGGTGAALPASGKSTAQVESPPNLVYPRLVPPAVLRHATLADVAGLVAMHQRCSPDSRYRRYLVAISEVRPASVRRLLTETATTVAESRDGQLVAMGNVDLGGDEAELALLVEDGWHRRGLGVCLASVLADQAVASGARVLTATVFGSNGAIRSTLTAAGLAPRIVGVDAGVLELHCDLLRWSRSRRQRLPSPLRAATSEGRPRARRARRTLLDSPPAERSPVRRHTRPPPAAVFPSSAAVAIAAAGRNTGGPVIEDEGAR